MKPLIILFILSLTPVCFAQSVASREPSDMEMQNFYLHPDSELLLRIIKNLDGEQSSLKDPGSVYPYVVFLPWPFQDMLTNMRDFISFPTNLIIRRKSYYIEKNDPAGIYKIHSVVYENNKNVEVEFDLSFQVVE